MAESPGLSIFAIEGIGEVTPETDLAQCLADVLGPAAGDRALRAGDVLVVTQKIVSKAEGRLVALDHDDEAAKVALIEAESVRVLRRRGSLLITETTHGFVCANAGIDLSNVEDGVAALLPLDPDRSARRLRADLRRALGVEAAVVISDTFGRTWREGVTDVAIGAAGLTPVLDLRGMPDAMGRTMLATQICVADELAGAADLVMGKAAGAPAAIVRGCPDEWLGTGSVADSIVRRPGDDLFR
jgi:coenzyme F420-0:L-glutamate ligase / coenzyme F420-1:gamma-L-glutamate ligase